MGSALFSSLNAHVAERVNKESKESDSIIANFLIVADHDTRFW